MSNVEVYGNIVTEEYVRDALEAHLRLWSPAYIAQVAAQMGLEGTPPPFASYDPVDEGVTTWPDDRLPAAVLVVGGWPEKAINRGGKLYAGWTVGVGTVASGQDNRGARKLIACYTAAVRACVWQHPSLGGAVSGCELLDESYNDLHDDSTRTLRGGRVLFNFYVDNITDGNLGPSAPPAAPDFDTPAVGTAETVTTTIQGKA